MHAKNYLFILCLMPLPGPSKFGPVFWSRLFRRGPVEYNYCEQLILRIIINNNMYGTPYQYTHPEIERERERKNPSQINLISFPSIRTSHSCSTRARTDIDVASIIFLKICSIRYSDKTDHGQNGPDETDHVSGQNGPRLRTKRTTFQDETDQASGQDGPRFWTKRALF